MHRASGGLGFALAVGLLGLGNANCNKDSGAPNGLGYSVNPAVYVKGTAITPNTPSSSGGAVASYAVLPALPTGLNLDGTTGTISGTPGTVAATTSYTVTATNTAGNTTVGVSITVNDVAPTTLSYSATSAAYTKGVAITHNVPTNTGGVVASYAVSPPLPAGLSLDSTSGVISGTPTAVTPMTSYAVTGSNPTGKATTSLSITVNDAAPTNLTYSSNPAVYTKDSVITPNVPSNDGGTVVAYTVAPALPSGLSIDSTSGVISGTPTAITAAASYTVTGTNTGGATTGSVTISVNDLPPSNLTYSTNPAVYIKGAAVTPNHPSNGGGGISSYAVAPALPAGLSLSTTTGIISGTPTAITSPANYTVTGTNSVGSAMATVTITVNDAAPSNLTYPVNPAVYTKNSAIAPNVPTNAGGAVVSYSVAPSLPTGLTLNTGTGAISGTPTALKATATYTVTANNTGGSTTVGVSITVNDVAPSGLTYASNPAVYTRGTAITPDLPSNGGGAVVSYSVAPALPSGLGLNTGTGAISGTPTAVKAAAIYTVTATNTGGSTNVGVTITVNDTPPTGLSYAVNPAVYTKGVGIASNTPTNGGGAVVSYSVAPVLPAGLGLNTTSGAISGTPSAVTGTGTYTVTATNTGGHATVGVSITVNDTPPTGLSYSTNPAVYTKGVAITANNPTSGGGAVVSYSVSPTLPTGLTVNTSTGVISGTPTAAKAAASYTITASNSGGSTTVGVTITVNDGPPTGLTYSTNPAVYDKAVAITPNIPSNGGGTIVSYSVSPVLPGGLSLSTTTGVISGMPTAVTSTATYTVTGTNASGSTTVGVTITVNDTPPSGLKYSTNPAVYTKGTAIAANSPSSSGGAVTSYSVSPTLPAGLALSTSSGVISGTPTAVTPAGNYTVTANNSGGSTTATVGITVNDIAPTGLTYSANPAVYTKGTAIPGNMPSSSGGAVVSYSVAPALPAGLNLSTTTGVISGTPTVVKALAVYTVTATNSGGNTTAGVTITVNDAAPINLTYAVNPAVYPKGTAITPNMPSNGGGAVVSYSVLPALPAGLSLSTTTGIVSGTPTTTTATATYAVMASNTGGSTTVGLSVTVTDSAPNGLTYSDNPAVYVVGTAIPVNVPTSSGGGATSYSVLPALPAGLSLNTTTGIISGTPTVVTATANYTVTATNSGGNATANVSITVNAVLPTRFAYAVNSTDNTISMYTVNGSTGDLRANGYVTAGTNPRSVAVNPSGSFAYVSNHGSNNVSAYSINASTGVLTAIGSPVASGTAPFSLAVDATGRFLYVANFQSNNVSAFSISATTGALTSIGTAAAGTGPTAIALDPTGKFAFVTNETSNNVSAYTIDPSTGALTTVGSIAADMGPVSLTVDPTSRFVYVANETSNDVSGYSINPTTGALTSIGATVPAETTPSSVTVEPSGKFVYVASTASNFIFAFSINQTTGALTSLGPPTDANSPDSLTVDPAGDTVYVSNFFTNQVSTYAIDSTGALTLIQQIGARPGATAVALAQGATVVRYVPKFAYVANATTNNVTVFSINASTGALTSVSTASAGTTPSSVAVDRLGKFAYVANSGSNNVTAFSISAGTGALTSVGTISAGTTPSSIAVDPSSSFVYVANSGSNDVSAYTISSTGALSSIGVTVAAGTTPVSVSVDPSGRFVYVANSGSNDVSAYNILANGALSSAGANATAGTGPSSVVVEGSGTYVYVANSGSGNVSVFILSETTGLLQAVGSPATAGSSPSSVCINPAAGFAYVANSGGNTLSGFSISPNSGALTTVGGAAGTGTNPLSVTVDVSGAFAYAANFGTNNVSAFSISASTGVLNSAGTVSAGTGPHGIAVAGTIQ